MQAKSDFIVSLADASTELSQVGGKGASLVGVAAAGLPAPPGFHINVAAYRQSVTKYEPQEQIPAAVSATTPDQPATLEDASSRNGQMITVDGDAGLVSTQVSRI